MNGPAVDIWMKLKGQLTLPPEGREKKERIYRLLRCCERMFCNITDDSFNIKTLMLVTLVKIGVPILCPEILILQMCDGGAKMTHGALRIEGLITTLRNVLSIIEFNKIPYV